MLPTFPGLVPCHRKVTNYRNSRRPSRKLPSTAARPGKPGAKPVVGRSYCKLSKLILYAMRNISLFTMSAFYVIAGVNHFWHEEFYLKIMPSWLPWHKALVAVSGICEIVFGLLLIISSTRRFASWCIILLLIAIFPANIQMMINYWNENNPNLWITIVRLPLQIILIWWAYSFTKLTDTLR